MIEIKLTHQQWQACWQWATQRHRDYLSNSRNDGKKRVVAMPYPGWAALAAALERRSFDRWGRARDRQLADDKTTIGTRSALTAITRKLAKMDGHPALRGEMVFGYSADEFIAWPGNAEVPQWTLWPKPAQPAVLLEPRYEPNPVVSAGQHQMRFSGGVTYWVATGPPGDTSEWDGWSFDEDEATGT